MKPVTWIALCVLCLAMSVLLVYLTTNADEFSRYNSGWNGTSRFFDSLDRHRVTEIEKPSELSGYTNSSLLVISPYRHFSSPESAVYRDYVLRGNTLILADDFGTGNELLSGMGSSVSIIPGNVSGVDRLYDSPYTIVAFPAGSATLPITQEKLVLDKGAAVSGGEAEVQTGLMSWIDTTGSSGPQPGTSLSRYSVVVHETLGRGSLYVVGDPSLFINSMLETEPGYTDAQFIHKLSTTREKILIDAYSTRADRLTGSRAVVHTIQTEAFYKLVIIAIVLIAVVIAWRKKII